MQYAWAIVGAKVVYIGPPMIKKLVWIGPIFEQDIEPSPLSPDKIYTLAAVQQWMNTNELAVLLKEYPGNFFHIQLFKPVEEKDSEMFNEWTLDLPTDLVVEDLAERIAENVE